MWRNSNGAALHDVNIIIKTEWELIIMAKRINILSAGTTVPFADGGLKLSKSIKISELENHPDFQELFLIDEKLLERIVNSINENGFDASQPVHIWKMADDNGTIHMYLIDGYTRIAALKKAGHETVPFFEHSFETFDDAYKYVLGLQVNRRNLEGSELLRNVSKLLGTEFVQNAEGKKSEVIAEVLGVSDRTVEKAISVAENADEETLAKIDNGELSVNKAYKQGKAKQKQNDQNVSPDDDELPPPFPEFAEEMSDDSKNLSDASDDNEGNPQSITVRSRDMSEHFTPPAESEVDTRLIERYKEGFVDGFKKAVSEVSFEVYDKICTFIAEGKSLEDLQTDNIFSDFSYEIFASKIAIPTDPEQILNKYNK